MALSSKVKVIEQHFNLCSKKVSSPRSKASFSFDLSKVVPDGDAVEARPEVDVKARNLQLGREQPLGGDAPQTVDDLWPQIS